MPRNVPPAAAATASFQALVVVTVTILVYCVTAICVDAAEPVRPKIPDTAPPRTTSPARSEPAQPPRNTVAGLPAAVADVRDALLAATLSGNIEDLREALAMNELPPALADGRIEDPIAHWRSISGDGEGREILAILQTLLLMPHAILPLGPDIENNRLFIWPAFADRPLASLTPGEQVLLLRLMPAPEAKAMTESGTYTGWRLAIGADGTWHSFKRGR